MTSTFATDAEWSTQPQTCCAHCGHVVGSPLPERCERCSRRPEASPRKYAVDLITERRCGT